MNRRLRGNANNTADLVEFLRGGPDYQRPEVETPVDWRWKVAEPRDHVPRGEWWKVFGDPALDALQAEAIAGNLGLQAAMFRVEQARANARITRADFYPTAGRRGNVHALPDFGQRAEPGAAL
jgi:outer membrane protein TolC